VKISNEDDARQIVSLGELRLAVSGGRKYGQVIYLPTHENKTPDSSAQAFS
jgi:hypothetical protein